MFSIPRYFRQTAATFAAFCCLLGLWGCTSPASVTSTSGQTLPSRPSEPASPTESTLPSTPTPTVPPESLPEEPLTEETGFLQPSASVASYRRPDAPGLFFAVNEAPVPGEIVGQEIVHSMVSMDGNVQALLTDQNVLWLVHPRALLKLSENVSYADLSVSGSYLIWIDAAGNLQGYDVGTGRMDSIAKNTASASLSPQGDAVAYSVSNSDGSISAWICIGGEARLFGEELMPFALSGKGELVYALDTRDGLLHILDETGASIGKASDLLPGGEVFLSSDHRQILFPCPEGWYLRDGSGGEFLIPDADIKNMVIPEGAVTLCRRSISICFATLPSKNLLGHFYLDRENSLWYLDTDASVSSVSQIVDPESVCVSWDGATLFYRWEDGTLFRTHRSCPGSPTILAAEVEAFAPTCDGAGIYCLDSENRLTYLEDFHDPRIVSEAVTDFGVTWDGYCLYLTARGEEGSTLWVSQLGSPGTPAETGAASLRITPSAVYLTLIKEEQLDLYCATEAFAFLLLAENVI